MMGDEMRRTDDTATEAELRELFDMEPDEELERCIQVCSGEWRHDGDVWRFYAGPDWDGDTSPELVA